MSVLELDRESTSDLIGMNPTAASAKNSCYLSGRKAILFPRVLQYQDIKDSKKKKRGVFLTLQTVSGLGVNKTQTRHVHKKVLLGILDVGRVYKERGFVGTICTTLLSGLRTDTGTGH